MEDNRQAANTPLLGGECALACCNSRL